MPIGGFRRSYVECRQLLTERLAEPAPGRIQLLAGPRQVGKTTLLLEVARELGDSRPDGEISFAARSKPEHDRLAGKLTQRFTPSI